MFADKDFFIFLALFSKTITFQLNCINPSKEIVIVKKKLNGIDIDDIVNLEDLLRIVLIHEECGDLKVFVDGGELTGNINKQKKPGVLQAYRCPVCDKCYRREYFFNTSVNPVR